MRKAIGIGLATAMAASALMVAGSTAATADACANIADPVGGLLPQKDSTGKVVNYMVLEYQYVKGIGTLRNLDPDGTGPLPSVRAQHLAHETESEALCKAVNIGAIGIRHNIKYDRKAPESPTNPITEPKGALVIFRPGTTTDEMVQYALTDPYNVYGLLKNYEIYPFTVVG